MKEVGRQKSRVKPEPIKPAVILQAVAFTIKRGRSISGEIKTKRSPYSGPDLESDRLATDDDGPIMRLFVYKYTKNTSKFKSCLCLSLSERGHQS